MVPKLGGSSLNSRAWRHWCSTSQRLHIYHHIIGVSLTHKADFAEMEWHAALTHYFQLPTLQLCSSILHSQTHSARYFSLLLPACAVVHCRVLELSPCLPNFLKTSCFCHLQPIREDERLTHGERVYLTLSNLSGNTTPDCSLISLMHVVLFYDTWKNASFQLVPLSTRGQYWIK